MIKTVKISLKELLGADYTGKVVESAEMLLGLRRKQANALAFEKIDCYPGFFAKKIDGLIKSIGKELLPGLKNTAKGAGTEAFKKASNLKASPIGGLGFFRLGEDGRLYLAAKSEHYHAPLGHNFPGYKLLENAARLGITNATHNNTRGFITRHLEEELVRTVNGLKKADKSGLTDILSSTRPQVLNRVINLETGSLAVEAGIKMMLARFYKLDKTFPVPKYSGKIPVFLVMGDREGGTNANYHGTTIFAQTMRGLWPEIYAKVEKTNLYKIVPVAINDPADFKKKIRKYNTGKFKTAGFLHEIIMMNYGGIKLEKSYLREAYKLCKEKDTPVLVDEIQSCMWYPGMYLFLNYGLKPDFVAIGKGFPGGQYPASKIITTAEMDTLNQFGALVTNGQEELASLAYLITMAFVEANGKHLKDIGSYYEKEVRKLVAKYKGTVDKVEGLELLTTIFFKTESQAAEFAKILMKECIDISAQTYKAKCPPAALTKLPVISSRKMVDYLVSRMENALRNI